MFDFFEKLKAANKTLMEKQNLFIGLVNES
jgi:hypothetical protein